jgi:hypothetical protein
MDEQPHYLKVILDSAKQASESLAKIHGTCTDYDDPCRRKHVREAHEAVSIMYANLLRPGIISEVGRMVVDSFRKVVIHEATLAECDAAYLEGMLGVYVAFVDSHYFRA